MTDIQNKIKSIPTASASAKSSANATKLSKKYTDFLQKYYYKSSTESANATTATTAENEKTNTRIGDKTSGISGGIYHIPEENYKDFLQLYHAEIYTKGRYEYLTEKQLESGGPILIDIDFRYDNSVTERQHSKDHVIDFICLVLDELKTMYQFDDQAHIPIFVCEKPNVNCIQSTDNKESVTKDGIHIMIGLQSDFTIQTILRTRILAKIDTIWTDLPITNTWEDVFDHGISKGCVNWQLFGCRKPNHDAYQLVYVFDAHMDTIDGEIVIPEIKPEVYITDVEKFVELSARFRRHPTLFMTNTFIQEYQRKKTGGSSSSSSAASSSSNHHINDMLGLLNRSSSSSASASSSISDIFNIRTQEQLDAMVQYFLESLSPVDFELREAHEYTMELPKSYYGAGSFTKWIRVGWALRNISPHLFLTWVAFSAQSDGFSYTSIRTDLWERWSTFQNNKDHGLTKRSIMYWVQQDNPEGYKKIKDQSLESFLDQTLDNCAVFANGNDRRGAKGSGDYDIATVLHQMFRDNYVCVSVKANIWYRFRHHRWEEIDSGTTLRKSISEELREVYMRKMQKMMRQLVALKGHDTEENVNKLKALQTRMDTIRDIIQRLSKTNDKKNIMVESKELFFDPLFLQRLDNNPNILCFSNGVVDFQEKVFRAGKPEDYISKCTNIPYVPLNPVHHKTIMDEVKDFMHKLFPCPELHTYMWDFLASTLIGNNINQTFNMFIGVGSNGKSILVTLMEQVLGEYKGDVPLTLLTQQRTKIGGLAPELVMLKGVRFAVMQEPSKGDRINEGIMKQVTGGDPIQARAPYMPQMVTFVPQFKLVVCSNYFMEIASQDHGTRRRIRVVDFESLFTDTPVDNDPEKPYQFKLDKKIKDKFGAWAGVFAAMLVEHAFRTDGNVHDCERVMSSSNSYLDRQDFIGEFITECIEPMETGCVQKHVLATRFREWYAVNFSGKSPNVRDIVDIMNKRFGKLTCGVWRGIRFKQQASLHGGSGYGDEGSIQTRSMQEAEGEFVDLEEI